MIVLRYEDGDIRVMLVSSCEFENTCVKVCESQHAHMVNRYVTKLEHDLFFDFLPYEWRSGTSDGLFVPIYPPRTKRVILCFDNL